MDYVTFRILKQAKKISDKEGWFFKSELQKKFRKLDIFEVEFKEISDYGVVTSDKLICGEWKNQPEEEALEDTSILLSKDEIKKMFKLFGVGPNPGHATGRYRLTHFEKKQLIEGERKKKQENKMSMRYWLTTAIAALALLNSIFGISDFLKGLITVYRAEPVEIYEMSDNEFEISELGQSTEERCHLSKN